MLKRKSVIGSLIFLVIANAPAQQEQKFVVLPPSAARTISARVMGDVDSYGSWLPGKVEIESLESNLSHIAQLNITGWNSSIRIEHPERYYRQYIGVTHARQKRIYINAFCDAPPPTNWRSHFYVVIDGASCYWQALYDPATKQFSNLTINARA